MFSAKYIPREFNGVSGIVEGGCVSDCSDGVFGVGGGAAALVLHLHGVLRPTHDG